MDSRRTRNPTGVALEENNFVGHMTGDPRLHVHRERSAQREESRALCQSAAPGMGESAQKLRLQCEAGVSFEFSKDPAFEKLDSVRRNIGADLQRQIAERRKDREATHGRELAEGMAFQESLGLLR